VSAYRDMDTYPASPDPDLRPVRLVTPYVTYVLLGLTVLVYLGQLVTPLVFGFDLAKALFAKVNEAIIDWQIWRLVTPVLVHGSLSHIFFNMYGLYIFGAEIEQRTGHWRFLLLYLLTGFSGNVVSFLLTDSPSVGASTAIFGLIAAQGVFYYQNRLLFRNHARQVVYNIVALIAINLLIGLSPGIDNWGHIGGLLGGLLFTWLGGPQWEVRGQTAEDRVVYDRRPAVATIGAAIVTAAVFGALAAIGFFR